MMNNVLDVDRGQPIIVIVTFGDGSPDAVNFSYTRPGSDQPFVDDGFGQPKSQIVCLSIGVYRYTFSTTGFPTGIGHWVCTGEWDAPLPDGHDSVTIRGKYSVRDAPATLI
jgi:hypothetical protein